MANGIKSLRQIQTSRESTQGTASTDYSVWRGIGTLLDARESVFPEEDIGIFGGAGRQYFPKLGAALEMESVEATYEQLPHIFDAGICYAAPTTDTGTGTGYIRTWTEPIVSSDTFASTDLKTYSFKCGDNNEVEKFGFGFVTEFSLSGAAGEAWMVNATWTGREVASDSDGFVSVTIPTVEEMLFSKTKLYIDDTTIGNTLVSDTLLGATLNINTGWSAVDTGSGRLDFSFIKQVAPEITLDITFEHNATATAEKAKWRAGTGRLIRLLCEGTALTTAGTYTYKTMTINLAGKWDSFEKIDEQDGNDIVTGHFIVHYNSTANLFAAITVVNQVSSMP